jgi:hypothetical protein
MRRAIVSAVVALTVFGMSTTAQAFPTATGTVINLVVSSTAAGSGPEEISFQVSNMPNTGCPSGGWFLFRPSDISDAQTRKNLVATLFAAKLTGASINVVYSNTICDAGYGYAIPIAIIIP